MRSFADFIKQDEQTEEGWEPHQINGTDYSIAWTELFRFLQSGDFDLREVDAPVIDVLALGVQLEKINTHEMLNFTGENISPADFMQRMQTKVLLINQILQRVQEKQMEEGQILGEARMELEEGRRRLANAQETQRKDEEELKKAAQEQEKARQDLETREGKFHEDASQFFQKQFDHIKTANQQQLIRETEDFLRIMQNILNGKYKRLGALQEYQRLVYLKYQLEEPLIKSAKKRDEIVDEIDEILGSELFAEADREEEATRKRQEEKQKRGLTHQPSSVMNFFQQTFSPAKKPIERTVSETSEGESAGRAMSEVSDEGSVASSVPTTPSKRPESRKTQRQFLEELRDRIGLMRFEENEKVVSSDREEGESAQRGPDEALHTPPPAP